MIVLVCKYSVCKVDDVHACVMMFQELWNDLCCVEHTVIIWAELYL